MQVAYLGDNPKKHRLGCKKPDREGREPRMESTKELLPRRSKGTPSCGGPPEGDCRETGRFILVSEGRLPPGHSHSRTSLTSRLTEHSLGTSKGPGAESHKGQQ